VCTSAAVQVPIRPNPKKANKGWNLRGTEELTVCESGWSLGIKGAGEIGWSASRGIGALSVVPPVAVRNLRIGWIIAAGGAELRSVETPIQLNRHYEQSKAIRGECYANQSS
jgi:hypothetical protein